MEKHFVIYKSYMHIYVAFVRNHCYLQITDNLQIKESVLRTNESVMEEANSMHLPVREMKQENNEGALPDGDKVCHSFGSIHR